MSEPAKDLEHALRRPEAMCGIAPDLPLLTTCDGCDGCGACCRHMIVPPFVMSGGRNEAQEKGVPQALVEEFWPRWQLRLQLPESACLWYDESSARCRQYELRPDACRAFEINSGPCRESRRKWGVDSAVSGSESPI